MLSNKKTEYLVKLPNGQLQWVAYSSDMLDTSDPDDRPVDAAIRAAKLPAGTHPVLEVGKLVKR